ncbi:conserved hypothetical protein [Ricinus communis]|uniref:Uncharacterized protein n=1 Tax=Ricinus communis TaxID=3988 RepID=B9THZ7_RICCO|nr:conserved hypothetical protein [Ricinus communis]
MKERPQEFMLRLRDALTASWDKQTAYLAVEEIGNLALGQCYPTSRVVQHYYPEMEIIKGLVWNGKSHEVHFWNGLCIGDEWYHFDLTWQQFPPTSVVQEFAVIKREDLSDSEGTLKRCELLLKRVDDRLNAGGSATI